MGNKVVLDPARKNWEQYWKLVRKYQVRFKATLHSREEAEAYIQNLKDNPLYFFTRTTLRTQEYGWGENRSLKYFVTLTGYMKNDETWGEDGRN